MRASALRILTVILLGSAITQAHAVYVYDNTINDQVSRLSAVDNLKFGDEVTLGANYPANPMMTHFEFEYWAINTTDLTVDVELRLNDGTPNNGYATPGTILYSYYGCALSDTERSTLNFDAGLDFAPSGIYLPGDTLTLCLTFHFTTGSAGVDLYDPPTEGSSYIDYWQYDNFGNIWQLTTNNVFGTVNFGMRIEAVPEPSVFALFALGGLGAFGLRRLLRRS